MNTTKSFFLSRKEYDALLGSSALTSAFKGNTEWSLTGVRFYLPEPEFMALRAAVIEYHELRAELEAIDGAMWLSAQ